MEEQQQQNALSSFFPAPPAFLYQHFTPENIERTELSRQAQSSQETPVALSQTVDLPQDLQFLQPPRLPNKYRSFGDNYNLTDALPTLSEQGIAQLYTPPSSPSSTPTSNTHPSTSFDRALILKRLAKSLLLNFLELMGIMSVNPAQYADKMADLRTLFINFHHLLNEYRPHQARESLILMMEEQIRRGEVEVENVNVLKGRMEEMLLGIVKDNGGANEKKDDAAEKGSSVEDEWRELDTEIWS